MMNEQFHKIAVASGLMHGIKHTSVDLDDEIEKFAELIVQECANRLTQDDFGSVRGVMRIAGMKLREHFGVK
jgi:hypothetical protein